MDCQCTFIAHSISNLLELVLFIIEWPHDQTIAMVQKEGRKEGRKEGVYVYVCACIHVYTLNLYMDFNM